MSQSELPSDLKARVLRRMEQSPAPTRRTERARAGMLLGAAVAIAFAVFLLRGGIRVTGRPAELIWGTSIGTASIAGLGMWIALGRRRSMVGRSTLALLVMACVAPLALLAWKTFYSSQFAGGLDPWPGRVGLRCFSLSLMMGVLPLVALIYARRRTDPTHPQIAGAAMGASVGLCVAIFVDLWCPVGYVPHFLLGHLLPIVLLALAGFWIGRVVLPPKER